MPSRLALLEHAGCDLRAAQQSAHLVGDHDLAERVAAIAVRVDAEAEYVRGLDIGLPIVKQRERSGLQFHELRADPTIRALRQARGIEP